MVKQIKREELKKKMDDGEDYVLIEVLDAGKYKEGHIKGAINIPLQKVGHEAVRQFDKDKEIIVYCSDSRCRASPVAAEKLDHMGFSNVLDYEGGKLDWQQAGYPMERDS
jgi:rhodanese-related sulfurtransferase